MRDSLSMIYAIKVVLIVCMTNNVLLLGNVKHKHLKWLTTIKHVFCYWQVIMLGPTPVRLDCPQ